MLTLMNFIRNVEDEVFEQIRHYVDNKSKFSMLPQIWVHQKNGRIIFDDSPTKPGYARKGAFWLCGYDKNGREVPDMKAIRKWVEEEVLMYSTR